jgi:hypothetical protein
MPPLTLTLPDNVPIIQAVVFHGSPTVPDTGQLRTAARGWIATRVAHSMRATLDEIVRGPLCIEIRASKSVRLPPYLGHCGRPDANERRRLAGDHAVLIRALEPPGGDRPTLWAAVSAARATALHLDGALVDLVAQLLVPRWLLTTAVPDPHRFAVMRHILVLASVGTNGLRWMTTGGLAGFGLPELQMKSIPLSLISETGMLMNGVAQVLVRAVSGVGPTRGLRRVVLDNPARVSVDDILEATAEATTTPDAASGQGVEVAPTPSPRGFLDLGPAAAGERKRWLRQAVTTLFGERQQTWQTSRSQPN